MRQRGGQTLADIDGARIDGDPAIGADVHVGTFERSGASDLGIHREPDARQSAGTPRNRLGLAQTGVVKHLERRLEGSRKVAAVEPHRAVDRADARVERQGFRWQQVAATDVGGIETELRGGQVQQALARERCLRLPSPPIRRHRTLVGHHRDGVDLDVGDAVRSGHRGGRQRRIDEAERAHVRAHVSDDPVA